MNIPFDVIDSIGWNDRVAEDERAAANQKFVEIKREFTKVTPDKIAWEESRHDIDVYIHSLTGPGMNGAWINIYTYVPPPAEWVVQSTIYWAVSLTIISVIGTIIFGNALVRPLRRLKNASDEYGRTGVFEAVDDDGPLDAAVLIRSFNSMGENLEIQRQSQISLIQSLSHDVRGPLGHAMFALQAGDAAGKERALNQIENALGIVSGITQLAEQTTLAGEKLPTDVRSLLEVVVDDAAQAGGAASFEFEYEPIVFARPQALERVFSNLISNALKYGDAARVRLFKVPGKDVRVTIDDDGEGIPEDMFDYVARPFAQLDKSQPGSGLGLSIVRSVLAEHGGRLDLANRAEGGLRATVILSE